MGTKCTFRGCDRSADMVEPVDPRFPESRLPLCARHVFVECVCGRLMPETMAADDLDCDTCSLERAEAESWDT